MGGGTPRLPKPLDDKEPLIKDPAIPDRMVTNKTANRPFLAHKEYKDKMDALHQAWVEKKKAHEEKLANGEKVGEFKERDPTAEVEVGLLGLLKFLAVVLVMILLAGKVSTGSYTWDYETKWIQLKTYIPTDQRLFTDNLLIQFDGSNEDKEKPILLAIDHDVYDVTSNAKTYGPGGSYHLMAGKDAARAYGTGCFKEHRTHDLRGLDEKELAGVEHWKKFFAEHKSYKKVGKIVHPPIDPASPIPVHCIPEKQAAAEARLEAAAEAAVKARRAARESSSGTDTDSASPPKENTEQEKRQEL